VFTARYALSPFIKQTRLVFKSPPNILGNEISIYFTLIYRFTRIFNP
jgi:hypothetical protein